MTRKQFYLDLGKFIMDDLKAKLATPIKHFDLWNDQTGPDWKKPFETPAIFLEFNPINWKSTGNHRQQALITFNLHIVTKIDYHSDYNNPLRDRNLMHLDIIDSLHYYLTGFHKDYFSSLTRISSVHDHYYAELTKQTEVYQTLLKTDSAVRKQRTLTGDLLNIETDIVID